MTRFHFLAPSAHSGLLRLADAEFVAGRLRDGGLAVLPTETGYLLAALATSLPALRTAFDVKERDRAHAMHVACASIGMASRYARLSPAARQLMGAFTPGPLTVVVPQTGALPDEMVTLGGTVGIRVPDHAATLQVIATLDAPITATSLNRSGEETRPFDRDLLDELPWGDVRDVPVVEDKSAVRYAAASTLVRLTGPAPEVLREGPVTAEEIAASL
ncbi:L-threonylcarbamoyladenylate synthase [Phytohabitans sp. ZYX-F-186]|uniref:L-threonylcarbamoyladenylate synthase n=1 Tax=Phytohabitans maris TaxID=3071409 RepID=A0ABU0ZH04_9ACTN|nr:L-threonylcarbamoyladenylate synthase [Phytohabitans sp. ZYX-F-186]MDQ7905627.1 L-threonylcarbamoyladenylate synthase [Phytohabitans sp. ZYX-F-186]